jgi:hypothetical protein
MPSGLVWSDDGVCGNVVFWGTVVSLAEAADDGVAEGLEVTADGVIIDEGLHAASRRMTAVDIPSFFDLSALDHVLVMDQSIPGHE